MRDIKLRNLTVLMLGVLVIGCSGSTPPGANSIGGATESGVNYTYHYWDEGLGILIWHDLSNSAESCSGSGSTQDPVYRLECNVEGLDGRQFGWQIHTSDGVEGELWIDGQSFDPSQGRMFLVSLTDGGTEISQLQRDFSEFAGDYRRIAAWVDSDPDVAKFAQQANEAAETVEENDSNPDENVADSNLEAFINELRKQDPSLEIGGQVDQPFFSVPGQIVTIQGEDVQIFSFPDVAQAEAEASLISPSGDTIGTSMVSWISTPNFYLVDNLIILYVGDSEAVNEKLRLAAGEPIAQGQDGSALPTDEEASQFNDGGLSFQEALSQGDFEALKGKMGETFTIGYWLSEGQVLTADEAVEMLENNLMPDPASITYTTDPDQFPDLGNVDPWTVFGPEVQITSLIFSQGWNEAGTGEAILVVAESEAGDPYWHGMIYSSGGFNTLPPQPPSFEASTYRNEEEGFEFDYPSSWNLEEQVLGSRGSGALFSLDGEVVFSAIVYLWGPKSDLDAYSEQRKLGWSSSSTVTAEEALVLPGGQHVFRYEIQGPDGSLGYSLLAEIGDKYLELFGTGEQELMMEIFQTLRLPETGSAELSEDLAAFESKLVEAVASEDAVQMQALMDDSFGFAFWGSEGYETSPEEAVQQLQQYLVHDQAASFDVEEPDLSQVTGPNGILTFWNPAYNPVKALFSSGWESDGLGEAFLIISQKPDGSFGWNGIIIASGANGGFAGLYSQPS